MVADYLANVCSDGKRFGSPFDGAKAGVLPGELHRAGNGRTALLAPSRAGPLTRTPLLADVRTHAQMRHLRPSLGAVAKYGHDTNFSSCPRPFSRRPRRG